jgi:MFS family permease
MRETKLSTLLTLLFGYFTYSMFRLSLGVVIPKMMNELSIDELKAGFLYSTPVWSSIVLLTPTGYLGDRFDRKTLLLIGYLLLSLGVLGLAFSSSFSDTFAFLLLAGVGGGFLIPTYYTLVGEAMRNVRGFAIGLATSVFYIGGLIGPILVGFFVSLNKWRVAYLIIGILIVCMLILQLIFIKHTVASNQAKQRLLFFNLLRVRNITVSAVGVLLGNVAIFAAAAWLPTFFMTVTQLDAARAGLLLGLFFLARAIGSITLGALSDRFGRRKLLTFSGFAAAFTTLPLLLTSQTFYAAAGFVIIFGFLASTFWSFFVAITQESVDREYVSSVTGLTQTFGLIGSAIGPIMAGAFIIRFGLILALFFTVTLTASALGFLSLLLIEKHQNGLASNKVTAFFIFNGVFGDRF